MKAVLKRAGYEIHEAGNGAEALEITDRQHIFDRFYQGYLSHATAGNGLGLAIVKKIIDLHGGHISVLSSGESSTFEVILNSK